MIKPSANLQKVSIAEAAKRTTGESHEQAGEDGWPGQNQNGLLRIVSGAAVCHQRAELDVPEAEKEEAMQLLARLSLGFNAAWFRDPAILDTTPPECVRQSWKRTASSSGNQAEAEDCSAK